MNRFENTILNQEETPVMNGLFNKASGISPLYYFNESTLDNYLTWLESNDDAMYPAVLSKIIVYIDWNYPDFTLELVKRMDESREQFRATMDTSIYASMISKLVRYDDAPVIKQQVLKLLGLIYYRIDIPALLKIKTPSPRE